MITPHIYSFDATRRSFLRDGMRDIVAGLFGYRLWANVGWLEVKQNFHGSFLGPFWVTLTTAIMSAGLGVAYSQIFGIPLSEYLPYVAGGIIVWGTISSAMNDGTAAFTRSSHIFKQVQIPISSFIFKLIFKNMILFFFRSIVFIVIVIGIQLELNRAMFLVLPGLLLIYFTAVWVALLLAALTARFRDVGQMTSALLTFIFLLTPIFWKAERLGDYSVYVNVNPFHHYISILREPMLGVVPDSLSYIVCIGLSILICGMSICVFGRVVHRIPYWC